MTKQNYIFFNCSGQIIPQTLDSDESGPVIVSMLQQHAVILPIVCSAETSTQALTLYEDKVKGNMDVLNVIAGSKSLLIK